MTLKIKITMDNEAFADSPEIEAARILRNIAGDMEKRSLEWIDGRGLYDFNGNKVGEATVSK